MAARRRRCRPGGRVRSAARRARTGGTRSRRDGGRPGCARLSVGRDRQQPPPAERVHTAAERVAHLRSAVPLPDLGGDGQSYVLAQHLDQRFRVGFFVGGDKPLEQAALPGIGFGGRRPVQPPVRPLIAQCRAGALERAVDRRDAHVEQAAASSAAGQLEHVAQDQHGALARRQELDHRQEGQLDRLAVDDRRASGSLARSARARRAARPGRAAATASRDRVAAATRAARRGAARPGRRWWRSCTATRAGLGAALERSRARQARRKRLLHEVLGLVEGAEHPVAVDVQLAPVPADQVVEVFHREITVPVDRLVFRSGTSAWTTTITKGSPDS